MNLDSFNALIYSIQSSTHTKFQNIMPHHAAASGLFARPARVSGSQDFFVLVWSIGPCRKEVLEPVTLVANRVQRMIQSDPNG